MGITQKRREFHDNTFYKGLIYRLFQPFLGILLSLLPAVLYGCGSEAATGVLQPKRSIRNVTLSDFHAELETLDVFVFRDDMMQKLDCYQRFDRFRDWTGTVVSGNGDRIISVLANGPYGRQDWAAVSSRPFLKGFTVRLEDERRGRQTMSGEMRSGGGSSSDSLHLRPFTSEIMLRSVCCDFSGKAYDGERISDVKVYLINANAESSVLEEGGSPPVRIVNAGRLRQEDVERFRDPGIILRELGEDIGKEKLFPEISLLCYRSCHPAETPGTPYTRLVIEGRVSGHTYYWPVTVNRDTEHGDGVRRNRRYIYDIRITGKGSDDPDVPVRSGDMTIIQKVKEWEEKEEYKVSF